MQNTPSSGGGIAIGTRADLFPSEALPELNSPGGPAYAARPRGEAASSLMAILCNSGLPTRIDIITAMRSIDHPSVLRLIDNGVVLWPGNNTHYMAYAFSRPLSPRLSLSLNEPHTVMSEDNINHYFVTPMVGALSEFQRTGIAHNGINPDNIFWRIGSATPPQLGECMSAPAGFGQPVAFEPLERALCSPLGRGTGTHHDDCYAFGITLAMIVLGLNPFKGMSDSAIIQAKIDRGSFGAVVGNRRLQPSHIELLRGLLADDARQRWSAEDLEQWMNGRRLTPKNTDAGKRASRAIEFGGKEYWHPRPLAGGLAGNVPDAVKIIENGTIDKWLRRSLDDEGRAESLAEAVNSLKESGKSANFEDQLVARACIALDSTAPIRYRGLSVMPGGISNLLVDALNTGNNIQPISEIISSQLVTLWVEMQKEAKPEYVSLAQQFERMRGLIEKTSLGNGLERVGYELNPGLPCLSPFLRSQYVSTPKQVLDALEHAATAPNRPRDPMDRHLAAFLVVRDRRSEILFSSMLAPEGTPKRGLAYLTLFSEMQYRYGPDRLPNLAQWLLPFLEPSISRFLGKALKEKLRAQIKDIVARGDLGALLQLVDDPHRIESDQRDFVSARVLYFNILKEVTAIEHKLNNRNLIVQSLGKPMAATLCSFIAIVFVVLAILRAGWQAVMH